MPPQKDSNNDGDGHEKVFYKVNSAKKNAKKSDS